MNCFQTRESDSTDAAQSVIATERAHDKEKKSARKHSVSHSYLCCMAPSATVHQKSIKANATAIEDGH